MEFEKLLLLCQQLTHSITMKKTMIAGALAAVLLGFTVPYTHAQESTVDDAALIRLLDSTDDASLDAEAAAETAATAKPETTKQHLPVNADPAKDSVSPCSEGFKKAVEALKPLSSPTDVKGFQAGLLSLMQHDCLGVHLTVHEEPKLRPFDSLTPEEAARTTVWYTAPKATMDLNSDWVRYYVATVAPRLDAFYRSAAKETEVYDVECVMSTLNDGTLALDYADTEWMNKVRNHGGDYSLFHMVVPTNPSDIDHLEAGRKIKVKVYMYYLPKAFTEPKGSYRQYNEIHACVYNAKGEYLMSIAKKYESDLHYSSRDLGWTFAWMMGWKLSIPVMDHAQFSLGEKDEYGGCLLTFRDPEVCFPDLALKKKMKEEAVEAEVERAKNPIELIILYALFLSTAPWMLWCLWKERGRKLPMVDEPEGCKDTVVTIDEFKTELMSDFMQPAVELASRLESLELEEGGTIDHVPNKEVLDSGFEILHKLHPMAAKMNAHDRFFYNRLAIIFNVSQSREISAPGFLLGIAGLMAICSVVGSFLFGFDNLYFAVAACNYVLCVFAPVYKSVMPPSLLIRGLRTMMVNFLPGGLKFVSNMYSEVEKNVTVYRDQHGNLYRDKDESNINTFFAVFLWIAVICIFIGLFPMFMIVDGVCNFIRNYIIRK